MSLWNPVTSLDEAKERSRDSWEQTAHTVSTVTGDPLGITRTVAGIDAKDPIGSRTQNATNDAFRSASDRARDYSPFNIGDVKLLTYAVGALAVVYTLGQLFTVEV